MPSNEDYLDSLLRNVGVGAEQKKMQAAEEEAPEAGLEDIAAQLNDLAADYEAPETGLEDIAAQLNDLAADYEVPDGLDDAVTQLNDLAADYEAPETGLEDIEAQLNDLAADYEVPDGLDDAVTQLDDLAADYEAPETGLEDMALQLDDLTADYEAPETDLEDAAAQLDDFAADLGDVWADSGDFAGKSEEPETASQDADVEAEDVAFDLENFVSGYEDFEAGLEESLGGLAADEESGPEETPVFDKAPDLDAVASMSEEDIERLLSSGQDEGGDQPAKEDADEGDWDQDVLGLLQDTEDSDLQDIQELLTKADNNEAVDEEIAALLQEPDAEDRTALPLDDESGEAPMTEKEKRAKARREKAAARKAQKAAAKEAKARAKAAAKEAKAAKGQAKGANSAAMTDGQAEKIPAQEAASNAPEDDFFDTDLLDSIVSAADQAKEPDSGDLPGGEESADLGDIFAAGGASEPDEEDFLGGDSFAMDDLGGDSDGLDDLGGGSDGLDDLGFDMGSLFGDGGDDHLGAGAGSAGDDSFPDFVDLDDSDSVDALLEKENAEKPKKGLLSRIFAFLTEEDPEESNEDIRLSDENRDILNDLDKEKSARKKKKKKGKMAAAQGEDGEEEDKKSAKKPKKAKKVKPEKVKKERIPEPEPLIPERKLTFKRVFPVFLAGASAGVLLIVFAYASVNYSGKQAAREAYYAGDYQACYENLYGKELNETEQIMFGTSESMLKMRLWLREYEMFVSAGSEIEALDSLIQTVQDYPKLYEYAQKWNAGSQVQSGYEDILSILSTKYGLSESQALEIANARSDLEYTRMVVDVVEGRIWEGQDAGTTGPADTGGSAGTTGPADTGENTGADAPAQPLEDQLPEEEGLGQGSFIQNP